MSHWDLAIDQIEKTRNYTRTLIDAIDDEDWYRQPSDGVTHVAWQVGHIAMAEYVLALRRIRGDQADDENLISSDFLARYGKGSIPDPDPANNDTPNELVSVLDAVHNQTVSELRTMPASVGDQSTDPHPMFTDKAGALQWCALHEMTHAGQLGLIRRLLGHSPLR